MQGHLEVMRYEGATRDSRRDNDVPCGLWREGELENIKKIIKFNFITRPLWLEDFRGFQM